MISTIAAADLADAVKIGWDYSRLLERNPHSPAQLTGTRDDAIARIVALQGGTANTTNVTAALEGDATPEAALTTISAL